MNYPETLAYMFAQLPMFQRIGAAAYKDNLDNTLALCKLLNQPQQKFNSIHIAGTNGKGSTSHMLASILQEYGLKTGLYTSPHLKDFRERIKINGQQVTEEFVVDFIEKYKSNFEQIKPSFFELTVGMAFDYFANEHVDVAVIEVGLGGRLDSTNVIIPRLSVITNISYDHMSLLGNTLEKIAEEKAGIIKQKVPVVIGESHSQTKQVFINKAHALQAPLVFADEMYNVTTHNYLHINDKLYLCADVVKNDKSAYKNLHSELPGIYQLKNIKTVLAAVDVLREIGYRITQQHVYDGIKNVVSNTQLLGRWQVLQNNPLVVVDIAHNEAGVKEIIFQLKELNIKDLHIVLGMVSDKDITAVLKLLPKYAYYYFCKAQIPRAMEAEKLMTLAKVENLKGNVYESVDKALYTAKLNAGKQGLVLVTGSNFTVAEALQMY